MKNILYTNYNFLKNIVGLFCLTMFFACEDEKPSEPFSMEKIPNAETENFQLIYTDSTRVRTILESAFNRDFSNQKFPYTEFPQGLTLTLFDNQKHENIISSRYAIYYLPTQMVELRDSVELTTYDGKILKTSQLFWQAQSDWVFTEKPFTYIDSLQGSITKGIGMDFDKNFSQLKARKITGIIPINNY